MRIAGILPVVIFFGSIQITTAQVESSKAMPHVLVYKAKEAYRNLVAVELSADRKSVVSYPDPSDIQTGTSSLVPVSLHGGYWLDKRGVSRNTAFIRLTNSEYKKLPQAPTREELYKMIIDKHPITELCDCGVRSDGNTAKQLNKLIDKHLLKTKCKQL